MDGREIPGFYFDPEKKKYFKIQKSHTAPRPDSKYTSENVKKEKKKKQAEHDAAARTKKHQKETIVKPHARNFLTQACLNREIGCRRRSYYLQHVWPDACVSELQNNPRTIVDQPEGSLIRYFDHDPYTKTLYAVHGEKKIKRRRLNTPDGVPLPSVELDLDCTGGLTLNEYSFEPWDELGRLTSDISSLAFLPASGALAATSIGSDRPPVVYLSDPDRDGPYVNQQFTPKNASTIWGSAARPLGFSYSSLPSNSIAATETENLAVAATNKLLLFTRSPAGSWDSATILQTNADILALEWLSPTIIALGGRNGKIRLYDTRSKGSSHILTHSSPISRLRRADDPTRLVCAGLEDTLCLYDIRSRQTLGSGSLSYNAAQDSEQDFRSRYPKNKRRKTRISHKECSQPVLSFRHSNSQHLLLDVDVHPRLGLIAAAQDTLTSVNIRLHNLWTGKLVKELQRPKNHEERSVQCLRFMDEDENGGPNFWANWNGGISKFCW